MPDRGDEVLERFGARGVQRAGETYFPLSDVDAILDALEEASVAVIGMEIFERHGDKIAPIAPIRDGDWSSLLRDSSWPAVVRATSRAARALLGEERARASADRTMVVLVTADDA